MQAIVKAAAGAARVRELIRRGNLPIDGRKEEAAAPMMSAECPMYTVIRALMLKGSGGTIDLCGSFL
ncbi:hypothetical protein LTR95_016901, partial [Oleoguttula sp. CCFEE 5521]